LHLQSLRRVSGYNLLLSVLTIFIWLGYLFAKALPANDEFLGIPYTDGSPWIGVLIFESLLTLCILQSPHPIASQVARGAGGIVACAGILGLSIGSHLEGAQGVFERIVGGYVWASHITFAILWRNGDHRRET
jgi:hypothetical protein